MKRYSLMICLSLILVVNSLHVRGQESNSWHTVLTGGWALPVGAFKRIAPEQGVVYEGDNPVIYGFDKKGNSYAENGYALGLAMRYSINNNWHLTSRISYTVNTVNTKVMNDYLDDFYNKDFDPSNPPAWGYKYHRVDHRDYQVMYFLAGMAYGLNVGRWPFSVNPQLGLASINYPDYSIVYLWTAYPYSAFRHEGETPSIQALM